MTPLEFHQDLCQQKTRVPELLHGILEVGENVNTHKVIAGI